MIRALDLLQRIEDQALDTLAADLSRAQGTRATAEARVGALQERAAQEARSQMTEALPYIGRFLAGLRHEQGRERQIAQQMSQRIEGLQAEVMDHFTRARSYQDLSDRLREARAKALQAEAEARIAETVEARFLRARNRDPGAQPL